ncbi:hypothetical protein HBI26_063530 [Parastagonospora nodorum]|nr:hypothetical protein HBI79_026620 [Parastagonospora nodorum]KAH4964655.1 hypothetical protein HBI78_110670 [Parastagonospora nodorum]KAH5031736.1 hypothetical protein HBI75_113440 [Parastagonospora nodorum]KAH5218018.1 hypothetical protein HBH77_049620 [Parastagonospora nodorum]KAH5277803.1 hypothetical protein HBI72_034080 [Parastagonospora nodorum]
MSGPSEQKRARVVQLYCPDHEVTVDNFIITPSMAHKDVVTAIMAAFRRYKIKEAWPCDINGEPLFANADCPSTLDDVVDGERLLIALDNDSPIYPEPPLEVVLYLDGDDLPKPLRKMSREDRRNHIRTLRRRDAVLRKNILRLNLPHMEVMAALNILASANARTLKARFSVTQSKRIIQDNWRVNEVQALELKCLATMAILSQATCGQPLLAENAMFDAKLARRSADASAPRDLQEEDVQKVIDDFYQAANAIGSDWPDDDDNAAIAARQGKNARHQSGKFKARMAQQDMVEEEEMGEEAAAVANPGKGKGKGRSVDYLAGKLSKTRIPDNRAPEADSDDDDDDAVRQPGRMRRN